MEHHIAQSSPISPRQKGMEGSRQALLYGVYDAFAGARSLISRRLCALITAIGIAVLTISSSAWATHPDITGITNPLVTVPAPDVVPIAVPPGDTASGDQLQPNSVHTEVISADGEVGNLDAAVSTAQSLAALAAPILDGSITSDDLKSIEDPDTSAGTPELSEAGAVTTDKINPGAVTSDKIGVGEVCGSVDTAASTTCETGSNNHIGEGSIGTDDLADGAVGNADLAAGAVSGSGGAGNNNIEANSITSADLEVVDSGGDGGAVDTANIVNGAVTADKLAGRRSLWRLGRHH